jgi:hypothetical protein
MMILQINNHHRIVGGSETVFVNPTALLREEGHEVVTFAARGEGDLPSAHAHHFPDAVLGLSAGGGEPRRLSEGTCR